MSYILGLSISVEEKGHPSTLINQLAGQHLRAAIEKPSDGQEKPLIQQDTERMDLSTSVENTNREALQTVVSWRESNIA